MGRSKNPYCRHRGQPCRTGTPVEETPGCLRHGRNGRRPPDGLRNRLAGIGRRWRSTLWNRQPRLCGPSPIPATAHRATIIVINYYYYGCSGKCCLVRGTRRLGLAAQAIGEPRARNGTHRQKVMSTNNNDSNCSTITYSRSTTTAVANN